jgi:hypothetical protein
VRRGGIFLLELQKTVQNSQVDQEERLREPAMPSLQQQFRPKNEVLFVHPAVDYIDFAGKGISEIRLSASIE